LTASAELGGAARITRFLRWFPGLMLLGGGLAMGIALFLKFGTKDLSVWIGPSVFILMHLVFVFVIAPLIGNRIKAQTKAALETLVHNSAALGADA
jgi:hypothetical protein